MALRLALILCLAVPGSDSAWPGCTLLYWLTSQSDSLAVVPARHTNSLSTIGQVVGGQGQGGGGARTGAGGVPRGCRSTGNSYQGRGFGLLWVSLAGPGLTLAGLVSPGRLALRLSSHRIVPDSTRHSSPYVSRFMRGAVPRSHFYGYPRRKYQIYSVNRLTLEDLTQCLSLAGKLCRLTRKYVQFNLATRRKFGK